MSIGEHVRSSEDPLLCDARQRGRQAGRSAASGLVPRVRADLDLLRRMVPILQSGEEAAVKELTSSGVATADIDEWRTGYIEGVEPIVTMFLQEVRGIAEFNTACAQIIDGLLQLGAAAQTLASVQAPRPPLPGLGGPPLHRKLRPEDFGCLPQPPA